MLYIHAQTLGFGVMYPYIYVDLYICDGLMYIFTCMHTNMNDLSFILALYLEDIGD